MYWYETRDPPGGGLFRNYVSLYNFTKSFFNLGSRHTSVGMPSSPGALPSFICLMVLSTSANEEVSVSLLRLAHISDQLDGWMCSYYLKRAVF